MATWRDVERIASSLEGAAPGLSHQGDTFKVKVSIWAWLDALDVDELAEILVDSWRARRGVRS